MRLPPKVKSTIEQYAQENIRSITEETIVLLCEAIHFRKSGIRLSPGSFHISDYTDGWGENEGNKRKVLLNKLVEEIKLELEEKKP